MQTRFMAIATRRNVDGKPDYEWHACWSDGSRMLFVTEEQALQYAKDRCAEAGHAMYAPSTWRIVKW